jgi:Subtilase family
MAGDSDIGAENTVVIDPYFYWAERTQFAYLFAGGVDERRIPVLIQLKEGWNAMRLARGEWPEWLRVAPAYEAPPPGLENSRFCTASVTQPFFTELRNPDSVLRSAVLRVELGLPFPGRPAWRMQPPQRPPRRRRSWPSPVHAIVSIWHRIIGCFRDASSAAAVPAAPRVVVGVIDDGLAFAHARFRRLDGTTRVEHFWNQDGPLNPPAEFPYGMELVKGGPTGIDAWMAACTNAGMVDEDDVYRGTGHVFLGASGHKPVAWRVAHGTHVMDLACGFEPGNVADQWQIIGVQLPVSATADPAGATLVPRIADALNYILRRAQSTPVVINISYGLTSGPHDGSSALEQLIDECIAARAGTTAPLAVVLPAGNSRQLRGHAHFSLDSQQVQQRLCWRVLPDDQTPSHVEIWLPKQPQGGPIARVRVRVTPPGAPGGTWVQEGDPPQDILVNGQFVGQITYTNAGVGGFHRGMILISILPTSTHDAARRIAPSGTWRIRMRRIDRDVPDIRAWIRRDDTPYGYPRRGRQSHFDDALYLRLDGAGRDVDVDNNCYIRRDGTLNSIATGSRSIVVGGFRRRTWLPSNYSAAGPVVHPPGRGAPSDDGPDAMAVSDDSYARDGVLAAGSRSRSCVAMQGTSVAAPQVTRWIAGQMAAGGAAAGPYDRAVVHTFARTGVAPVTGADAVNRTEANPPPWAAVPPAPPASRGGAGRIEFVPQHRDRGIEVN